MSNIRWQMSNVRIARAIVLMLLVLLLFPRAALTQTVKPEDLVKQAVALEKEGKWQEARANYLAALEKKPKSGEANFRLGRLYLEHESLSQAVPRLEAAREYRYDRFQVERQLALAYFRTGRFTSAIELYQGLIENKPKQSDLRSELAEVYYANDNLEEAHVQDSIALQLDVKNLAAHMVHGQIHSRQHEFELARAAYRQVLLTRPDYTPAFEALAELFKSAEPDSAIYYYRRYLAAKPDDANVNFALSGLYYNLSQRAEPQNLPPAPDPKDSMAVKKWNATRDSLTAVLRAAHSESAFVFVGNAIRLGFGREDVYDFYIKVAQAAHKRAASIVALRAFLDINARDPIKWALLGQVYADSGDVPQSINCYKEACALDSTMQRRVYAWIAQQYYRQKQYDSAIVYYPKVTVLDPKAASAYFSRGYAYIQKGMRSQGMSDLEKGLTLDAKNVAPRVYLMTLYYQDKDYNQAYELAKAVLEIAPDNEQAKAIKKNIDIMRAPKPKPDEE